MAEPEAIQPDLSVCLLHPGTDPAAHLGLIESLIAHADPVSFELILVAADPQHPALAAIEACHPETTILENNPTDPPAKAKNHAFRLACGRYISFWDESIRFGPEGLAPLIRFLDETPEAGLAAPRIVDQQGIVLASVRGTPTLATILMGHTPLGQLLPTAPLILKRHYLIDRNHLRSFEADWLLDTGLIIRREVCEDIAYFDEGFVSRYADADYCIRAARAGWHLHYLAEALVTLNRPEALAVSLTQRESIPRLAGDCTRLLLKKWLGLTAIASLT